MKPVAVLACFNADPAGLETIFARIGDHVAAVILVDNGSSEQHRVALRNHLEHRLEHRAGGLALIPILQGHNTGLADAQNCGIKAAQEMGATQILLLDQDSRPAPDMIPALQAALAQLQATDQRVAAIGPRYAEPHRDARDSSQTQPNSTRKTAQPIKAIIASGALIPVEALQQVGLFDEALFIDLVDTEWCFRAGAAGYGCFVAPAARMEHRIGDQVLRLGGRDRSVHAPFRSYYQIRNLLLLARLPHVPKLWVLAQLAVMLPRALVMAAFVPPRLPRATLPLLGLWHGLLGRSGRLRD